MSDLERKVAAAIESVELPVDLVEQMKALLGENTRWLELAALLCASFNLPDLFSTVQKEIERNQQGKKPEPSRLGYGLWRAGADRDGDRQWPSLAWSLACASNEGTGSVAAVLEMHPDIWAVDIEVWSMLRTTRGEAPVPLREIAWRWLTSPGRKVVQNLKMLAGLPGEEQSRDSGVVEWSRDRIYRAAGIEPGCPPRDDGPPGWLELHRAVPGYHHLWCPDGGGLRALRLMESGRPTFLQGMAFGWLLNQTTTSPVFEIGDWRDSLTTALPGRVAQAFGLLSRTCPVEGDAESLAEAELELILLRHAARLTEGDPRLDDADRWRVARWLYGCIMDSLFHGAVPVVLVDNLKELLGKWARKEVAVEKYRSVLRLVEPWRPLESQRALFCLDADNLRPERLEAPSGGAQSLDAGRSSEPLWTVALNRVRGLEDPDVTADLLSELAPYRPEIALQMTLDRSEQLGPWLQANVLLALAPYCPRQVLDCTEDVIDDPALRASIWREVASYCPDDVEHRLQSLDDPELVEWVREVMTDKTTPAIPVQTMPDASLLQSVFAAILSGDEVRDHDLWSDLLFTLVPYLPEQVAREALLGLEPLHQILLQSAALQAIEANEVRQAVLADALAATRTLETLKDWNEAWSALAPHAPDEAVEAVRRCMGISGLAPDALESAPDLLELAIALGAAEHFRADNPTPLVPTPAPVTAVLRRLAQEPLTESQLAAEAPPQGWCRDRWRLSDVTPALLIRRVMTRHHLPWLATSSVGVLEQCFQLLVQDPQRFEYVAHVIFMEGEVFSPELADRCRSRWRDLVRGSSPIEPRLLSTIGLGVLHGMEADAGDLDQLFALIEQTNPLQQVSLLSAWVERARHRPEHVRRVLDRLIDLAAREDVSEDARLGAAYYATRGLQRSPSDLLSGLEPRLRELADHPPFQGQSTFLRELKRLHVRS